MQRFCLQEQGSLESQTRVSHWKDEPKFGLAVSGHLLSGAISEAYGKQMLHS